jgi:hypothetical protein
MTRRFVLIVVALITWFAFSSVAAPQSAPGISVSPGTPISSDSPNAPFVETFLAINPVDPQNLIATSIVGTNGSTGSRVYASRVWRSHLAPGTNNHRPAFLMLFICQPEITRRRSDGRKHN